jgi:hypothetical protein
LLQSGEKVSDRKFPVNFKEFQSSGLEKVFYIVYLGITIGVNNNFTKIGK